MCSTETEAESVYVHGEGAMGNGNITVTGNFFDRNYGQNAIYAEDTDGILIADNRFITSPVPLPDRHRTLLDFKSTKNITLKNNVAENFSKNDTLVNLGRNVDGVIGNDATGITLAAAKTTVPDNASTSTSNKSQ